MAFRSFKLQLTRVDYHRNNAGDAPVIGAHDLSNLIRFQFDDITQYGHDARWVASITYSSGSRTAESLLHRPAQQMLSTCAFSPFLIVSFTGEVAEYHRAVNQPKAVQGSDFPLPPCH